MNIEHKPKKEILQEKKGERGIRSEVQNRKEKKRERKEERKKEERKERSREKRGRGKIKTGKMEKKTLKNREEMRKIGCDDSI